MPEVIGQGNIGMTMDSMSQYSGLTGTTAYTMTTIISASGKRRK
jgi:hypothetical protein